MKNFLAFCSCIVSLIFLSACSGLKNTPSNQFADGYYRLHSPTHKPAKVYLKIEDDSITIFPSEFSAIQLQSPVFVRPTFDFDVLTIPFKYRPSSFNFPRQLDTDFNGNVYLGYRLDRFRVLDLSTPAGVKRQIRHRALSVGGFGGVGSSFVSAWTTNYRTTDEYSGLILSKGLALLAGINNYTVGVGVGWDTLTDRDKSIWIYQNKPWYGITIGLNIN
jgi:hypothetical protein